MNSFVLLRKGSVISDGHRGYLAKLTQKRETYSEIHKIKSRIIAHNA